MKPLTVLGWAMGVNRWHDETGTFHLIKIVDNLSSDACGGALYTGGVELDPDETPKRGRKCRRCLAILRAARAAKPEDIDND